MITNVIVSPHATKLDFNFRSAVQCTIGLSLSNIAIVLYAVIQMENLWGNKPVMIFEIPINRKFIYGCDFVLLKHIKDINTLRPRQNGRYVADGIFKCFFLNEHIWIPTKISLNYVPVGLIDNVAWHRLGDKPLSEPMMGKFGDAYMRFSAWTKWSTFWRRYFQMYLFDTFFLSYKINRKSARGRLRWRRSFLGNWTWMSSIN